MTTASQYTSNSLSPVNASSYPNINGLNFPAGYGQIPLFNSNLAIQNYVNARNAELLMAARLNSASLNYSAQGVVSSTGCLNNPISGASLPFNSTSTETVFSSQSAISSPSVCASMSPPASTVNPPGFWEINQPATDQMSAQINQERNNLSNQSQENRSVSTSTSPNSEVPNTENNSSENNAKEVLIINTILAFIKSESFRKDKHAVIESVVKNFSFEEIMICREELYRKSGCKRYQYRPPPDPASTNVKASHCVSSIITKCVDLEQNSVTLKIACDADEIFRLSKIQSNNNKKDDHEERISVIENEIKSLKLKCQQPVMQNVPSHLNDFPQLPQRNRSQSRSNNPQGVQPSNRRGGQYSEMAGKSPKPSTPIGAKRPRLTDNDNDNWTTVTNRNKNSHRPAYWGRNDDNSTSSALRGVENLEVFLFNYTETATEEAVKEHFVSRGIKVINVTQKSHPESYLKSFCMKITERKEFDIILKCLPYQTAARWFVRPRFNRNGNLPQHMMDRRFATPRTPVGAIHRNENTPARRHMTTRRDSTQASPARDVPAENEVNTVRSPRSTAAGITPITSQSVSNSSPKFQIGGPVSLQTLTNNDNDHMSIPMPNSPEPTNNDG